MSSLPPSPAREHGKHAAIDLGCGSNGTNVGLLAAHAYLAAGVDLVAEAVARARRGAAAWLDAHQRRQQPPPTQQLPPVAFAVVDLLGAAETRLRSWDDVRRMEAEQQQGQEARSAGAADAGGRRAKGAGSGFSLLFDCQTYHVLRTVADEAEVVARYRAMLEPGGVLLVLTGRPPGADEEDCGSAPAGRPRSDGPNVALSELRAAFCPATGWREREIVATRFDPTPAYEARPDGPPLAWAAVLERAD
jgi:hypothetical protein